ncbi:hypothetical protein AX769_16270 [Frondihabitans sp. PAMC 28766]|nr:hypothetical protein AX769_16270 [Frondihabitans sp. PAMC 28766]
MVLTGDAAVGVALGERGLDSGVRFVVLGLDGGVDDAGSSSRSAPAPGSSGRRLDAGMAAQAIAGRHPAVGVLVVADTVRDHPYNFARRMLSLDHLTKGRVGILVTPQPSAPVAGAIEFAQIIATLWETFPRDAIVTDRARGRFAESGRIRRLDHTGAWSIAGPLTTPSSVQGRPPVVWLGSRTDAEAAGRTGCSWWVPAARWPPWSHSSPPPHPATGRPP